MGKRGPKREPNNLKLVKGNPGHQKLNKDEPKPLPIAPSAPEWLDPMAHQIWTMNALMLERLGLLTEADGNSFAMYCQAYARLIQAETAITEYVKLHEKMTYTFVSRAGAENEVAIPEIGVAKSYHAIAARLAASFGMEPSSRGLMHVKRGVDTEDEMEKVLR